MRKIQLFFLIILTALPGFVSCGGSKPKKPAEENASANFYEGLKAEAQYHIPEAAELFESALESPGGIRRREAANRLASLLPNLPDAEKIAERIESRFEKIRNDGKKKIRKQEFSDDARKELGEIEMRRLETACLFVRGKYGEAIKLNEDAEGAAGNLQLLLSYAYSNSDGWLSKVRDAIYAPRAGETAQANVEQDDFLRAVAKAAGSQAVPGAARTLELGAADAAALDGRLALSARDYDGALALFSQAREDAPELFFRYQGLLGDLGRAYENTNEKIGKITKREEGIALFGEWLASPPAAEMGATLFRYTLLFYSGRIARKQNKNEDAAIAFFKEALEIAPDARQQDACIWYILSTALNSKPATASALAKTYAARWKADASFADILGQLCRYLVDAKKWKELDELFALIKDQGAAAAQYAYLLGRAAQLGYAKTALAANDYFSIAYEEGNGSFYYRALAASHLDKAVVPNVASASKTDSAGESELLQFYRGFFENLASDLIQPYLRRSRAAMSDYELRVIAGLLAGEGRYLESINLVGYYMGRENYRLERDDLELFYPRPFADLIETNAKNAGLDIAVFYGLVRVESAFMPDIVSRAGAIGLTQIMPATGREINATLKKRGDADAAANGYINLRDPETNVRFGAVYLSGLVKSMGSPMLALMAYNGGPSRVRRLRRAAPNLPEDIFLETIANNENREYGKRVMGAAAAYGYLYYGLSMEEVVADIFK